MGAAPAAADLPALAPRGERKRPILIDLFCGAGGCSRGYHDAGFDVVGVDWRPQPCYPYPMAVMDALAVPVGWLSGADAIHASPPCQAYSRTMNIRAWDGRAPMLADPPDLVGLTRDLLLAAGRPYIIENVPGAPLRGHVVQICGAALPGLRVIRHRVFETDWLAFGVPCPGRHPRIEVNSFQPGAQRHHVTWTGYMTIAGHIFQRAPALDALGVDWDVRPNKTVAQMIPPAYTRHLGRQLLRIVRPPGL